MGRKHKENVRDYYQKWMEEKAQRLVDQTSKLLVPLDFKMFFFIELFFKMNLAAAFKSGKIQPGAFPPRFPMPPPLGTKYIRRRLEI